MNNEYKDLVIEINAKNDIVEYDIEDNTEIKFDTNSIPGTKFVRLNIKKSTYIKYPKEVIWVDHNYMVKNTPHFGLDTQVTLSFSKYKDNEVIRAMYLHFEDLNSLKESK